MSPMAPQCSQDYFLAPRRPPTSVPSMHMLSHPPMPTPPTGAPPGYSSGPVPPAMASPLPAPRNLSLHALRCHISFTVRTSGGSSQIFLCMCVRACTCAHTRAHACDLTRLWVPSGLSLQSLGFSARICRFSGTVCWSGVEVCSSSPRGQSGGGLQSAPKPRCAQVLLQPCPLGLGWVCSGGPEALRPPQAWSFPPRPGLSFCDADRRAELLPLSLEAINAKLSLSPRPSVPPPLSSSLSPLPAFLPHSPPTPSPWSCKHLSYHLNSPPKRNCHMGVMTSGSRSEPLGSNLGPCDLRQVVSLLHASVSSSVK